MPTSLQIAFLQGTSESEDQTIDTRAGSDCIDVDEITNYTPNIDCDVYCSCMCRDDLAEDAALNYADLVMNYSGGATSGKAGKGGKSGKNGRRERELSSSSGKGKGGKGYDSGNRFADAALVAIMARANDVAYGQCACSPCEAPVIDNYAPSAGDTEEVIVIMPNPVTPSPTSLVTEAKVVVPVTPAPTPKPSFSPTKSPTEQPTFNPTKSPTKKPTPVSILIHILCRFCDDFRGEIGPSSHISNKILFFLPCLTGTNPPAISRAHQEAEPCSYSGKCITLSLAPFGMRFSDTKSRIFSHILLQFSLDNCLVGANPAPLECANAPTNK